MLNREKFLKRKNLAYRKNHPLRDSNPRPLALKANMLTTTPGGPRPTNAQKHTSTKIVIHFIAHKRIKALFERAIVSTVLKSTSNQQVLSISHSFYINFLSVSKSKFLKNLPQDEVHADDYDASVCCLIFGHRKSRQRLFCTRKLLSLVTRVPLPTKPTTGVRASLAVHQRSLQTHQQSLFRSNQEI